MLKKVATDKAPAAIGPYSQGIIANGFLFASGQIPIIPATGAIAEGDITVQAKQVMENIGEILKEAGTDYEHVVEKALEKNGGNRKKAAKELGISDRTLYRRIKQYGLDKNEK